MEFEVTAIEADAGRMSYTDVREVKLEFLAFSKVEARAMFERVLIATDLPEGTTKKKEIKP